MPYTAGVYAAQANSFNPAVAGSAINATDWAAMLADLATALSTCLLKDGTQTLTANIPMGGFKLTGLAAGSATGNSLRYEQLFTTSAVALLGAMDWVKGADVTSATTTNLTTATGNAVHVTGTTTITAVTLGSGLWRLVIFDGALTLTHHATNNNLPGAANITTAAGDRALYWSDGTTVYCVTYMRADGTLFSGVATQAQQEAASSTTVAVTPGRQQFHPCAAKAWVKWDSSGIVAASYNVSSVTDSGSGNFVVNFTTSFSSTSYGINAVAQDTNPPVIAGFGTVQVGSCVVNFRVAAGTLTDSAASYSASFFGDQ